MNGDSAAGKIREIKVGTGEEEFFVSLSSFSFFLLFFEIYYNKTYSILLHAGHERDYNKIIRI